MKSAKQFDLPETLEASAIGRHLATVARQDGGGNPQRKTAAEWWHAQITRLAAQFSQHEHGGKARA